MFILRIIPVTWAQITRVWPFADEEKLELSRHGKMPTVMTIIISFVNIYGKHQSCHEYSRYNSKIPHSNKWGSRRKKVLLFAKRKMHFGLVISSFSLLNPSFLYLSSLFLVAQDLNIIFGGKVKVFSLSTMAIVWNKSKQPLEIVYLAAGIEQ